MTIDIHSRRVRWISIPVFAGLLVYGCVHGPGATNETTPRVSSEATTGLDEDVAAAARPAPTASKRSLTSGQWRAQVTDASDEVERLDRLRGLFHAHRRDGDNDQAMQVFDEIIDLLERCFSIETAQRGAYSDAQLVHRRRDHVLAARMYETLIRHYPQGTYYWETLHGLGLCLMNVDRCVEAEVAFQQVIGGATSSMLVALAWQQLALCQAQGGKPVDALKSLDDMAAHFEGTRHADAARLTRGHLLARAGDVSAAREAYATIAAGGKDFQIRITAHHELKRLEISGAEAPSR